MKTTMNRYGQLIVLLFVFGFGIVTSEAQVKLSGNNIQINAPGVSIDLSGMNTAIHVDDADYDDDDVDDDVDIDVESPATRININNNLTGIRINQE